MATFLVTVTTFTRKSASLHRAFTRKSASLHKKVWAMAAMVARSTEVVTSEVERRYGRLQGQLLNLSIVSALILSFIIGILASFSPTPEGHGFYRSILHAGSGTSTKWAFGQATTRAFIVTLLEEVNFNFTVSLGNDDVLDIKSWLLRDDVPISSSGYAVTDAQRQDVNDAEAVYVLTKDVIPLPRLEAYILRNPQQNYALNSADGIWACIKWSSLSQALTVFCLVTALLSYFALDRMAAKKNSQLLTFMRWLEAMTNVVGIVLMVTLILFLTAVAGLVEVKLGVYAQRVFWTRDSDLVLVPALAAAIGYLLIAFCVSLRSSRAKEAAQAHV